MKQGDIIFSNIRCDQCLEVRVEQKTKQRLSFNHAMGSRKGCLQFLRTDHLCDNCIHQLWAELESELRLLRVLRARQREWKYLYRAHAQISHIIDWNSVADAVRRSYCNRVPGWCPNASELLNQSSVAYHEYCDQKAYISVYLLPNIMMVLKGEQ